MIHCSKNGQRFQVFFLWEHRCAAERFASALLKRGQRVRINHPTNNGYHSYQEHIVVMFGSAVRKPMSKFEISQNLSDACYCQYLRTQNQLWVSVSRLQ